jgi:hypothetical protein
MSISDCQQSNCQSKSCLSVAKTTLEGSRGLEKTPHRSGGQDAAGQLAPWPHLSALASYVGSPPPYGLHLHCLFKSV